MKRTRRTDPPTHALAPCSSRTAFSRLMLLRSARLRSRASSLLRSIPSLSAPLPTESTLVNRAKDQLFVIDEFSRRSEGEGFLSGLVDAENSAIIGYSMGGYGALNAGGAGYSAAAAETAFVPPGSLKPRVTGNFETDSRVKAVVAFAPWGGPAALEAIGVPGLSFFDPDGLAGLRVPTLFVVGDEDAYFAVRHAT